MSHLGFSLAGNLKCTSSQALRQGWKVCCACMLFPAYTTSPPPGVENKSSAYFCNHILPVMAGHVYFVLLVWRPVSVSLCFLAVSSANLDEKTASAVTLLQQIINMQNQVGGKWLFCLGFWVVVFLQWQRSSRVWIVLPVPLSLHR